MQITLPVPFQNIRYTLHEYNDRRYINCLSHQLRVIVELGAQHGQEDLSLLFA